MCTKGEAPNLGFAVCELLLKRDSSPKGGKEERGGWHEAQAPSHIVKNYKQASF